MADEALAHRREHARVRVARARAHEETLGWIERRTVGLAWRRVSRVSSEPQFLCESDALQLAGRADGNLGENEDLPRHLEVGELTFGELAQLLVARLPRPA